MGFKEIVAPLVSRGVPVIPLRPKAKVAFIAKWEQHASTAPEVIEKWNQEYRDNNAAAVAFARPDGFWFFEIDRPGYKEEIEKQTGKKLPQTLMVRSSPGRGHLYFKHTPASLAMGNISGKGPDGKELWSARADRRYVVAPGSIHPTTLLPYEIVLDAPIVEAPDWLVEWCLAHKSDEKTNIPEIDNNDEHVYEGNRNNAMTSFLGKARQAMGFDSEKLYRLGMTWNDYYYHPPLSESEIRTIANSVGRYKITEIRNIFDNIPKQEQETEDKPVAIPKIPYPVFPEWAMKGTSIYEGFCKPWCDKNSRYAEFMFMPAMVMVLNFLGQKIEVKTKRLIPSFYLIMIGKKGQVIKSSSVTDAIEYLEMAGIVQHGGSETSTGQNKTWIWQIGSPEGLGIQMARSNNRNVVLFYDELSTLIKKAGIEKSTLKDRLLEIYESAKFQNVIKSRKDNYNIEPRTYTVSLIACTTDAKFQSQWSVVSSDDDGFNDRFFFLYQPEQLRQLTSYVAVDTLESAKAARKTRQLIDKALNQKIYEISNPQQINEFNDLCKQNRVVHRMEKMALFFAVDLGRDEIDEDCVERAIAISKYEMAVKEYVKTFESHTVEGMLQNNMIQILQRFGGTMSLREFQKQNHPTRYGLALWRRAYNEMVLGGWIREDGTGKRGDPRTVTLMKIPQED